MSKDQDLIARSLRPLAAALIASFAVGCGSAPPPEAPPGKPMNPPQQDDSLMEMMGPTEPSQPAAPAPDAKKLEEQKKLEEDFAKLEADLAKEKARFTDDVRKQLGALASKAHGDTKVALGAILKGSHRTPGNADRDKWRHPVETLGFFQVKPTSSVLELDAGGGWYTELLAPLLASKGKLSVTGPDPNGPTTERATLYGKRLRGFLDKAPELGSKVSFVVVDRAAPKFGDADAYDVVLAMRTLHNWERAGTLDKNLAEAFRVTKPGGVFGVEQHRAAAGADPKTVSEKGYLPEQYVIDRAVAAGFKLDQKSEINANAKDTRDHADGVWSLPPSYRSGDKDKYAAIGESDRMTLRFVKPKK
jgi:predicted methyltransferase